MPRCVLVALLVAACQGHGSEPPPPPPPPPLVAHAAPIDATAPVSAIAPAPIDASVTTDGVARALRWGYATIYADGVTVELFSDPIDCTTRNRVGDQTTPGAEVRVVVPPGPGATFYAGHATSADIFVFARDQAASPPGHTAATLGLGKLPFVAQLTDASSVVTLQPVERKVGSRVRGTLDGAEGTVLGAAAVHGTFDVELCEDSTTVTPLRAVAPTGPARGHRGKTALAPKSYQAIVWSSAATHDEAIEMALDRSKHGSLAQIWMIVGYAQAHVACPVPGSWWSPDAAPVVYFQRVGGTARTHPTIGVPQPTKLVVPKPGTNEIDVVWPAWVQLDAVSYTAGDVLHATVWSQASSSDDAKGDFGGRLDAVVCTP